uniref:Uncharacterized protein n=1 Tax=Chrysotila carterae TaxID=13221 RepID=A0A7S4EUZ1_CHRCT
MWSILAEVNLEQNTGTDKVAAKEAPAEAELRYAKAVAMCIRTEAKAAQPPSEGHHEEKPREETTTKGSQMEKGGSKKDRSKESSQKGGKKSKKEALSAVQIAMLQVEHEQLQTCYQALRREVEQKQDVVDHIQAERKHALLKIMAEQMDVEIKQQRAAFRKEIDAAEVATCIMHADR